MRIALLLVSILFVTFLTGCSGPEPEGDMTPPKGSQSMGASGTSSGAGNAQQAEPTAE